MKIRDREKAVGRWISLINRYTQIYLGKELKPVGIGPGQGIPFVELFANEGKSQDELSELIKIDKATTARALAKLEEKGYITRKMDPYDKRVRRVFLTDKAKGVAPRFFAIFYEWTDALIQGFSSEEKKQLLSYLERMAQNAINKTEK